MLFLHYQLRLVFTICLIIIIHGEYIKDEIKVTIPDHSLANELSSITYIDRSNMSLFVRQHIQIENKTRHIYISPLALFDINQTKLLLNRTTIIIPLMLYTNEQINFIREHNTNQWKKYQAKCLFHQVSTATMRVIYKYKLDQTVLSNSYRQYINSIWLSYDPNLLYVHIDCRSNETCLKFNEILHRSKKPLGLHLEYSIQPAEQHQMIISHKHLLKTTIYSSPNSPSKFILEHDVEQVLQELLYAADIRNNGTYVLSQIDLVLLKEKLRKQLLGKSLILTDEQQWNLIYWKNNQTIRPDHLLKLLKKKIDSKYLSNKITKNIEIDNYVRQIYDKQSLDLYLKYRHLFELYQINDTQGELVTSLKLKPILVYELNKFNRSTFLVHQPMHMTKREDIHLIPIRSILPLKETQQLANQPDDNFSILDRIQRVIEKIRKLIIDSQSMATSSTTERTSIETTESTEPWIYESTETQLTSITDSDATSITSAKPLSTTTRMTEVNSTIQSPTTAPSATTAVTIRYGSSHGGPGGGSFDDGIDLKLSPMKPCIGVEVFWRSHLFAIRFIYEPDNSSIPKIYHGHRGNLNNVNLPLSNETFLLSNEERINKVTLYAGTGEGTGNRVWVTGNPTIRYIMGIQFHTTTGRTSPLYGTEGEEKFTESYEGFTLGYAKGRSGLLIDMLQFVWYNQGMGITVAGGRGRGSATNQLHAPRSLFIDDDQTMVIADTGNHRIVQWKLGDINGQVVAGGNGKGDRLDQLNQPTSVVIDKVMDSLIICDSQNRRVVQWYRRNGSIQGEIRIGNISCLGVSIDDQGGLYVSSGEENQEVRRFEREDKIGTIVAGGHGPGSGLNQCDNPFFTFVDQQQNVYVADNRGHRIMKWSKGAKEGIVVAGGHGRGNGSTQFDHPNGLFVDTKGTLYVADDLNSRVMCWPQGAQQGTVVAGGNGWGEAANQFRGVADLLFDRHGQLYVVDGRNDRVQRFSIK